MRGLIVAALFMALPGCVYVTKAEFEEYWDNDGDGWPLDDDCNDDNVDIYPHAPDVRGDGCDADCGREEDSDGDDWPDLSDCEPDDPDIHPCSKLEVNDDNVDHDCDGLTTVRPDACPGKDPDFPDAQPIAQCGGGDEE